MQASRLSQGAPLSQHALAAPEAAAPPSVAAAIAVNQALDAEPPTLCLQLDSTTLPELLPLQDPTPLVSHPGTCSSAAWGDPTIKSACSRRSGVKEVAVQAYSGSNHQPAASAGSAGRLPSSSCSNWGLPAFAGVPFPSKMSSGHCCML